MSNNVIPHSGAANVPMALRNQLLSLDDLSAGVSGSFAVVSFKGSKFRVKYQGEETMVLNADGDPAASLEAVLVKANGHLTKNYYKVGYTEGATEKPDCFSLDGVRPDREAPLPQASTCAMCPQNVFGSRMTPAGKKAKACQDNRRVAVVPLNDMRNEIYGGPMLLRIPAGSLGDLAQMGKELKARGFPYNAVAVKIAFDHNVAYPKLTFRPLRPLTEEEATAVAEHLSDDKLDRILSSTAVEVDPHVVDTAPAAAPEPAPAPAPAPVDSFWAGNAPPMAPAAPVAGAKPTKPKAAKPAAAVVQATVATPAAPPAVAAAVAAAAAAPPVARDAEPAGLEDDIENILAGLDLS